MVILLPGESQTLTAPISQARGTVPREVSKCTYRYVDRGEDRTADFPLDPNDDISGVISSASSGPLRDYQDKLKVIQLREKGLSKTEIAEKVGRSEHWVKRWWREHPATLERPVGSRDVVLKKASVNAFRDLDIRRGFIKESSTFDSLVKKVSWKQAKVVVRDSNTGELTLRYNEKGQSVSSGRQVADYTGGLDFLDEILQKVFSQMNIRDPQARIFMNFYADGKDKIAAHRHDFWTCLLSFGSPRILTVDRRPVLLRDGDLIVFGTQTHGVPTMPDITDGRVSLVIFFYPDADNLERQWQTINEDDEEEKSITDVRTLSTGMDKGFKASLLWGDSKEESTGKHCGCGTHSSEAALNHALDPSNTKRSLLSSPNSGLQFDGLPQGAPNTEGITVFSVATGGQHGYGDDQRLEEKDFFKLLSRHGITALWDFRIRETDWSEPSSFKRACAARSISYRTYPLGRREAGGMQGHLQSEEGQDVLRRFAEVSTQAAAAFAVAQSGSTAGSSRAEVAEQLSSGKFGQIKVMHILPDGQLLEHQERSLQATPPKPAEPVTTESPAITSAVPAEVVEVESGQRRNRWGRRKA
ncbi:unnamed protein product [Durusdinium trenchii]|uniref:Uncharacterized protein n=2 Tax=Durusdinium trenchii TaxID=1381693 RepID=A0ABP0M6Q5_9DINO